MKVFHFVHACVTLLLLAAVIALGLKAINTPDKRIPEKPPNLDAPVVEQKPAVKPPGHKAKLLVVRGLKPGEEYFVFEGPYFIGRTDQKARRNRSHVPGIGGTDLEFTAARRRSLRKGGSLH